MGHIKKSLIFSALRYLEYALIALSYIIIAKKVGPAEYGKTIPGFIFITYSQYLMVGLNQALIKAYVVDSDLKLKQTFVRNTLYYVFFISFVCFVIGLAILPSQLFMVSLISSMIYFQSIFQTLLRLEDKILGINFSNLVFSIIYFISVFFYAKNIQMFFLFWLISLAISNFMNGVQAYPILKKLQLRFHKGDLAEVAKTIRPQIASGVKMTLIGLVNTYFLTYDRFVLNLFSQNKALNGNYQLSDNIASTIYLFIVTVLFYYSPTLLKRASLSYTNRVQILRYGTIFAIVLAGLAVLVTPLVDIVILKYFPAYQAVTHFLTYQFTLKIVVLTISVASYISIALNMEVKFLKLWFWIVLISSLILIALYKYSGMDTQQIIILALVVQSAMILLGNAIYLLTNRKRFFVPEMTLAVQ